MNKSNTKHGMIATSTYRSWMAMKYRCKAKPLYVNRGITVCDHWKIFLNFFEDMGHRPEGTTLDRIDNDGNYEPGNCRWATGKVQHTNKRNNVNITVDGVTLTQSEWAERLGTSHQVIQYRLKKGWSAHAAVTTAVASRQ